MWLFFILVQIIVMIVYCFDWFVCVCVCLCVVCVCLCACMCVYLSHYLFACVCLWLCCVSSSTFSIHSHSSFLCVALCDFIKDQDSLVKISSICDLILTLSHNKVTVGNGSHAVTSKMIQMRGGGNPGHTSRHIKSDPKGIYPGHTSRSAPVVTAWCMSERLALACDFQSVYLWWIHCTVVYSIACGARGACLPVEQGVGVWLAGDCWQNAVGDSGVISCCHPSQGLRRSEWLKANCLSIYLSITVLNCRFWQWGVHWGLCGVE